MASKKPPMTAEEFAKRPAKAAEELVLGKVVRLEPGGPSHESAIEAALRGFAGLAEGRLVPKARVITRRNPDTVRVADLAFYGPSGEVPEWVAEVRSPNESWPAMLARVVEYHGAGVGTIYVLDEDSRTAHVYGPDRLPRVLKDGEDLVIAGGFAVPVARFFA